MSIGSSYYRIFTLFTNVRKTGAGIEDEQFRETDYNGHKTQNEENKYKSQNTKGTSNMIRTRKRGVYPGAREGLAVSYFRRHPPSFSYSQGQKCIAVDRRMANRYVEGKRSIVIGQINVS